MDFCNLSTLETEADDCFKSVAIRATVLSPVSRNKQQIFKYMCACVHACVSITDVCKVFK